MDSTACQGLADAARGADVALLRYRSVRDPARGANLAVLVCSAFARPAPLARQTWKIRIAPGRVQALCDFPTASLEFSIANFAADPRLAGWGNEFGELKSLGSGFEKSRYPALAD